MLTDFFFFFGGGEALVVHVGEVVWNHEFATILASASPSIKSRVFYSDYTIIKIVMFL